MIGGSIALILVLAFIWRTTWFYFQIRNGTAIPPRTFSESITIDSTASASSLVAGDASLLDTDDDPAIGASKDRALLTIVEFADFGCPYSREASYIVRAIADFTPFVRYVYRDYPIVNLHPNADMAAEAGECAQDQGRFFDYHDKLYQNQFNLTTPNLKRYAKEIGLNTAQFNECLDTRKYRSEVEEDRIAGEEAGVRGTPTFFFNETKIEGSIPRDFFMSILQQFERNQNKEE